MDNKFFNTIKDIRAKAISKIREEINHNNFEESWSKIDKLHTLTKDRNHKIAMAKASHLGDMKHKVHVHVSKDGGPVKIHKEIVVAKDKHKAEHEARRNLHNAGYKVHDSKYMGMVKEELDLTEVLKSSDPVGKWIRDFMDSDNPKFSGKSKEERRKMALGAYYAAQKESYENPTEELAEGRGRPPKEGSKAWHAAKEKTSAGESSDQEADKNIVNQMRKKPVGDTHHLVFGNGDKKDVHVKHVNKALSMLANTPKPADREKLQASLGHSHKRFMDTVTSGKPVEDMARPKVSLGKMKAESVETSDSGPEKAYIENGKVVVRKKARKDIKIEDFDSEVTNSLNNLYLSLSEDNKALFEEKILSDRGIVDLINFAKDQGF